MTANDNNDQLVIRDSGAIVRIAGVIFAASSLIFFLIKMPLPGLAFVVGGLAMLLFSADLIITADRSTRTLSLEYRYLLYRAGRKIAFDDIEEIHAEFHRSVSHGRSSSGYRLAALLKNGKNLPFRLTYAGNRGMTKQAKQLSTFINPKTPVRRTKAAEQVAQAAGSEPIVESNAE
jgi:hypothetical protein